LLFGIHLPSESRFKKILQAFYSLLKKLEVFNSFPFILFISDKMATAFNEARYESRGLRTKYDRTAGKTEDGDFNVNFQYADFLGMKDKNRIPKIDENVYKRIEKFAKENGMKVKKLRTAFANTPPSVFYLLGKKKQAGSIKQAIGNVLRRDTVDWLIQVEDHLFLASEGCLFEKFGKEVYGLKTEEEKSSSS